MDGERSLAGITVVVTGAGAGLGRAMTLAVARAGAVVFGVSNVPAEVKGLEREARRAGVAVHSLVADVSDAARATEVVEAVLHGAGRLDVLINNAAIIVEHPLEETPPSEWDRIINVNLRGTYLYTRAVLPTMKAQRGGLIINVSSRAGKYGLASETAYCASKFGVEGFTRALALETEADGIWAVTVHPGYPINTPMSHTTYDETLRRIWKDPAELAPGIVTLIHGRCAAMTGGRYDIWRLSRDGLPADFAPYTADFRRPMPSYL